MARQRQIGLVLAWTVYSQFSNPDIIGGVQETCSVLTGWRPERRQAEIFMLELRQE